MDMGDGFSVLAGSDVLMARSLILALGVAARVTFPGEAEHLGAGVSYCATCDGMLYRGKTVAVIGQAHDAPEEANALFDIGCDVIYFGLGGRPQALNPAIKFHTAKKYQVTGAGAVETLLADGQSYPVSGVFVLRETLSPAGCCPAWRWKTALFRWTAPWPPTCPACSPPGDCTGRPLQIAKAVGDGNVAALSAAEFLARKSKKTSGKKRGAFPLLFPF